MDRKKLVLLVGALVIAIGTALIARSLFAGAAAPTAEAAAVAPQGPKVLVAQRALPAGTIITADSVGYQLWPKELVRDAYFVDGEADIKKLIGTVVRHPVTAGEPLTQGSLVSPGDRGFLAAALAPGMRAVTISVSAQTGVGGFIFPGDRVDLVLSVQISGENNAKLSAAETILGNLRVLATDQTTVQEKGDKGETVVKPFDTVTLEVTPRMAEKIAVAQKVGTLSLSLRSLSDGEGEIDRAVAAGAVKIPDNATPEEEERLLRQAVRGPREERGSFATGGDVSRFERSTLPPIGSSSRASAPAPMGPSAPVYSGGQSAPAAPSGPTVRVYRGKEAQAVPIASAARTGLGQTAGGLAAAGKTIPGATTATLAF